MSKLRLFLSRILCLHYWTTEITIPGVIFKWDWQENVKTFGCLKCGKVKDFPFNHIPINYIDERGHLERKEVPNE